MITTGIDHTQMRLVMDELQRVLQVVRKNMIANEGGALLRAAMEDAGITDTEAERERLLTDMFPYVFGPSSLMHPLLRVTSAYDAGETPAGSSIYNILVIVHRLDKSGVILKAFETYARQEAQPLPKPSPIMAMDDLL